MKVYCSGDLRKAKTDKIDSRIIANYGIDHWFTMTEFQASEDIYGELKLLVQPFSADLLIYHLRSSISAISSPRFHIIFIIVFSLNMQF